MPSSLQALVAAPPSGRSRPLLIDSDRYATEVVLQGAPDPVDGHRRADRTTSAKVTSLLGPDAVWIDVAAFVRGIRDDIT